MKRMRTDQANPASLPKLWMLPRGKRKPQQGEDAIQSAQRPAVFDSKEFLVPRGRKNEVYSARSVLAGSTLAARHVGRPHAITDTPASSAITPK